MTRSFQLVTTESSHGSYERELLSRIASGDKAAFSDLYDRLSPAVYQTAFRLLGDVERAEQVVSKIFLTLWREGRVRAESRLAVKAWAVCRVHQFAAELSSEEEGRFHSTVDEISGQQPGGCNLEDILITQTLFDRAIRAPDFNLENEALVELIHGLIVSPEAILQNLVDVTCRLCHAGSAGISVVERVGGEDVFRWRATSGEYRKLAGGTLPRHFSPCGVVLDRSAPQLMSEPARYYPYISDLTPRPEEVLLVPFFRAGRAVGTVWIVSHEKDRNFDSEDARLVGALARFAAAAIHTVEFGAAE